MKRIAIIAAYLYGGGAERAAGLLSKYLNGIYEVYLFLTDIKHIVYGYGGILVDVGIEGPDYFEYYIGLYKERYKIDCAISFTEQFNFANIKTRKNEKVIISERCVQSLLEDPLCHEDYQVRALYDMADSVVSVAEGVKYDLIDSYGIDKDRIKTIYNFIDQEDIRKKADLEEQIDRKDFLEGHKLAVNIGRLEKQKDQKRLIRAFAHLAQERNDVRLLIIGSGSLEKELTDLIDGLGAGDYIKILPYCKNPFPYLKKASVFILTSKTEGLPNVVLEAMCLGIPIVAVDCIAGPRELLTGECSYEKRIEGAKCCQRGILVENMASEEGDHLKEAISLMLDDKRYADEVIEYELTYMRGYSNERILQDWVNVIEGPRCALSAEKSDPLPDKKIVVYGAGDYGKRMVAQLRRDGIKIFAVVVSDTRNDPSSVFDIPVRSIEEMHCYKDEIRIVIGVSVRYQSEVVKTCLSLGYDDLQFVCLRPWKET